MPTDYERDAEYDGPGGRGPIRDAFSKVHADLFPEIKILGGEYQFAHCVGMMYGSPHWYVGGKEVDQRNILIEIYKQRGITEAQKEEAAEIAKNFVLAWYIYDCVHKKPDCWDKSEVLKNIDFTEPYVEIIENPKQQDSDSKSYGWDITVARITYWSTKDKTTKRSEENNYRLEECLPPSMVENWKTWELKYFDVEISTSGSDKEIGKIHGGGRKKSVKNCAFKTTPDGLHASSVVDSDFDFY